MTQQMLDVVKYLANQVIFYWEYDLAGTLATAGIYIINRNKSKE